MPVSHDEHENDRGPSARMDWPFSLYRCNIQAPIFCLTLQCQYAQSKLRGKGCLFQKHSFSRRSQSTWFFVVETDPAWLPHISLVAQPTFSRKWKWHPDSCSLGNSNTPLDQAIMLKFLLPRFLSNTLSMYWREKKTPCPTVIFPHVKHTLTISENTAQPPWLSYLTQLLAPASVISSSPPTLALALLNLDSWTPSPLKLGTHHHNHHSFSFSNYTLLCSASPSVVTTISFSSSSRHGSP